jgi:hypothetical protein
MDTLSHHWYGSWFRRKGFSEQFWNPAVSWENKYENWFCLFGKYIKVPSQISDAWHIFKTLMIIFMVLSIVTYNPVSSWWWVDLLIYGTVWNVWFSTIYWILDESRRSKKD